MTKPIFGIECFLERSPASAARSGKNLELEKEAILSYIKAHNPITISVNFIPEGIPIDYAFLSNYRRYVQLNNRLLEHADAQGRPVRVIATSNVTNVKDTHLITP